MFAKTTSYFADGEDVREPHSREWWTETVNNNREHNVAERNDGGNRQGNGNPAGRNLRDVLTLGPEGFRGAHYAVFPRALPAVCIKAGTSARGVCPQCGAPWARILKASPEYEAKLEAGRNHFSWKGERRSQAEVIGNAFGDKPAGGSADYRTLGWRATCACNAGEPIGAVVLDPFSGSGTTVSVAIDLGRRGIGLDLSPAYHELATQRSPLLMAL
jgi:hypothetical protein